MSAHRRDCAPVETGSPKSRRHRLNKDMHITLIRDWSVLYGEAKVRYTAWGDVNVGGGRR